MDADRIEEITGWNSRAFDGGYAGLRDLVDQGFTGGVTDGTAWLVFLNGRVIGVFDGTVDSFEGADGTAYSAPDPSVALLFAMQEIGGNVRAQYYTNETPLSEADGTLTSGNFTGYVELSENVLSGDYYVVYHRGKSLATAFVGNSRRLKIGDEAFDLANEEVGIYKVYDVDLEITEIPGSGVGDDSQTESGSESDSDSEIQTDSQTGSESKAGVNADSQAELESRSEIEADSLVESETESGSDSDSETEPDSKTYNEVSSSEPDSGSASESASGQDSTTDNSADLKSGVLADIAGSSENSTSDADQSDDDVEEEISATDPQSASLDIASSSSAPQDGDPSSLESKETSVEDRSEEDITQERKSSVESTDTDLSQTRDEDSLVQNSRDDTGRPPDDRDSTDTNGADIRGSISEEVSEPAVPSEFVDKEDNPDTSEESVTSGQVTDISNEEQEDQKDEQKQTEAEVDGDGSIQDSSSATVAQNNRTTEQNESESDEKSESQQARSIPAVDPDNSSTAEPSVNSSESESSSEATTPRADSGSSPATTSSPEGPSKRKLDTSAQSVDTQDQNARSNTTTPAERRASTREDEYHQRIENLELALDKAETRRDELLTERDKIAAERDQYEQTIQQLESELEELEATVDQLETELAGSQTQSSGGERMSSQEALSGTNLLIRYDSQGGATLERAHGGQATQEDLKENLRIEHHTTFETQNVTVDGQPFEEWLHGSIQYGFTRWVVEELLFEIRDSENTNELLELYDAISKLHRADIEGDTEFVTAEDGDETDESRSFDVVLRNRMGVPVFIAELNNSREPTTDGPLRRLVTGGKMLQKSTPEFAAAFSVTESFFDPDALNTAKEATDGGFFSRDTQRSYVKLSRKQGFHLCLVESRAGGFRLNVPQL